MSALTKEEVLSKCSDELIASRDCAEIARVCSVGRFRYNEREIGNGTILETIGLDAGNALLDVLYTNQQFRYVKPLVDQGRMAVGSPLVQATLNTLVPTVLTQLQADALSNLGKDPDPYTAQEVAEVLYNIDGSLK